MKTKFTGLLVGLVALAALIIIPFTLYQKSYGGPTYYTKIVGEPESTGYSKEIQTNTYDYKQLSFSEKGEEKTVALHETRDNPLRVGAYLKMVVNDTKGVIKWEEVQEDEIPQTIKQKLTTL